MILKPAGMICTRYAVKKLADENPDVQEIDLSQTEVAGGSTMHQFFLSFPGAKFTGVDGFNKWLYDFITESINSEEFKRNSQSNK